MMRQEFNLSELILKLYGFVYNGRNFFRYAYFTLLMDQESFFVPKIIYQGGT